MHTLGSKCLVCCKLVPLVIPIVGLDSGDGFMAVQAVQRSLLCVSICHQVLMRSGVIRLGVLRGTCLYPCGEITFRSCACGPCYCMRRRVLEVYVQQR